MTRQCRQMSCDRFGDRVLVTQSRIDKACAHERGGVCKNGQFLRIREHDYRLVETADATGTVSLWLRDVLKHDGVRIIFAKQLRYPP